METIILTITAEMLKKPVGEVLHTIKSCLEPDSKSTFKITINDRQIFINAETDIDVILAEYYVSFIKEHNVIGPKNTVFSKEEKDELISKLKSQQRYDWTYHVEDYLKTF